MEIVNRMLYVLVGKAILSANNSPCIEINYLLYEKGDTTSQANKNWFLTARSPLLSAEYKCGVASAFDQQRLQHKQIVIDQ